MLCGKVSEKLLKPAGKTLWATLLRLQSMSIFKKLFGRSDKSHKYSENKKLNLSSLLSSEDANDIVIKLDNYIGELCSLGDEIDKLTEEQKLFYYNQCLEREINNGGFSQYFFNSSGDFTHQTLQSLQTIGATKTADILQKAIDQFPDKKVPHDRNERKEILEQIEETVSPIWEELDQKFLKYEEDLNTMHIEFVKKNMDKF